MNEVRTETKSVMDAPACLSASRRYAMPTAFPQRSPREVFRRPEAGRAREVTRSRSAGLRTTPVPIPLIFLAGVGWAPGAGASWSTPSASVVWVLRAWIRARSLRMRMLTSCTARGIAM